MTSKFKKGDQVQLISGGPAMTVDGTPGERKNPRHKPDEYWCTWFKGATQDFGSFGEHLLRSFTPPSS